MSLPTSEHFARAQFRDLLTSDTRKATDDATPAVITVAEGTYYLHSTVTCYFVMGLSDVTAPSATTGVPAEAGYTGPLCFDAECTTIKVINGSGDTGVASLVKVR